MATDSWLELPENSGGTGAVTSVNGQTGLVFLDSDDIPEGSTNLYYTDARARAAFSATSPLLYNSGTGNFSIQQANTTDNGFLSAVDWNVFNGKFTLPALTAGSVLFSDGTTIAEDNANFFWNDTDNALLLGKNTSFNSSYVLQVDQSKLSLFGDGTLISGDLRSLVRIGYKEIDPSTGVAATRLGLLSTIDVEFTDDNATALISDYHTIKVKIAAGKSMISPIANHFSNIGRTDAADEGATPYLVNNVSSLTWGNSAARTAGLYTSYLAAFHSVDSQGTIANWYDFYSMSSSIGAGVVTNMYGIVIEPVSGYDKQNWLCGKLMLGGGSIVSTSDTLYIDGDMTMTGLIHSTDTNESIDANARHLITSSGNNVVLWDSQLLADNLGSDSINWGTRRLQDSSGNPTMQWDTGNVDVMQVGKGLQLKEGSDARLGTAVLVGGTVTVSNTSVTANSRIFVSINAASGTLGSVYVTNIVAATSFDINSTSVLDTSTVAWMIVEGT